MLALPGVIAQFNRGVERPPGWVTFIESYLVRATTRST
jgi:hypothetical protein